MKFGVMFANVGPMGSAEGAIGIAQGAEAAGIESLWTVEHTVVPAGYQSAYPYSDSGRMPGPEDSPIPDPLIWLTFVAGATSTIRLATGILILPQRNPVVLAKEIATLDQLSGGRVELGVGVGWLEEEFDAIGVPFRERGKRTDDHIEALRALWIAEPGHLPGGLHQLQGRVLPAGAGAGAGPDPHRRPHQVRGAGAPGGWATGSSRAPSPTRSWPRSSR